MEAVVKRQFSYSGMSGRPMERSYAHSVSGGAGGYGIKISTANYGSRLGSGFSGYDYNVSGSTSGTFAIGNEKMAMQHLNDRLASYLETVKNLEKANSQLEIKIREVIEKRGPMEGRDFGRFYVVIAELREKIFNMIKGNAHLAIALDNARLASDDFRMKMEYELSMRQTVEADVSRLRKLLDDTNVIRLHLEGDIESLKEELITLKRNHELEVAELRTQVVQGSIHVDVDAPKGQDLSKIMEEIRAKYERIALKNREELKAWHESQITAVQSQVTESTMALKEATSSLSETRRRYQALDIELQSALGLKGSLEATVHDIEMRYNMELEKYNSIIVRLQEELTQIRADIQQNTREYEVLLNIKIKLEVEIAEYRRLLDGELRLDDALEKKVQTKVVTVTQTLVDGKVVSESKDVQSSEQIVN